MSLVKRNIIANLIGGGILAALTIIITPLQINILGMEAFGIVAFITTLQITFRVLDMGLSSTLTRELAADQSDGKRSSNELVRTASTIYWIAALVIGVALYAMAGTIAQGWFKATTLDVSLIEKSLQVIALYLALRWPVSLYTGLLTGLQRMDILNAVKVSTATVRLLGGIAVLIYWPSLYIFLLWTALNSLIEVLVFIIACYRTHPTMSLRPKIAWGELKRVWRFSVTMNALAILAVLIIQLDRFYISRLLTLEDLGYYSLAYGVVGGLSIIITSISSVMLPSFTAARSRGDSTHILLNKYNDANCAMLFLVGFGVFILIFFGDFLLSNWINPGAAIDATLPMILLAVAFWWGAVIANSYSLGIASGLHGKYLRVNLIVFFPYAIGLYWMIGKFGISGAAGFFILLNITYAALLLPSVQRDIFGISTIRWLLKSPLQFAIIGIISFGMPRMCADLLLPQAGYKLYFLALIVGALIYMSLSYILLDKRLKDNLRQIFLLRTR